MSNQQDTCTTTADTPLFLTESSNITSPNAAVLQALALSTLVMIAVSYAKFHIDKRNTINDYIGFFLELPIDIGSVFISLFMSYYFAHLVLLWIVNVIGVMKSIFQAAFCAIQWS